MAPAGTPKEIVDKLHKDIETAQDSPDVQKQFDHQGATVMKMSTPEFAAFIQSEMNKWQRVVKDGKLKKE
jgi:tripartite-type tricarboxylate transporter receptor subunit TctC